MTTSYIVKRGDTLSQIAKQHGFLNWQVVWDDPGNDAVRAKRGRPELIQPGDEVLIPVKSVKFEKVDAKKPARFQLVQAPPLAAITINLVDRKGAAYAALEVGLRLPSASTVQTFISDDQGLIEVKDPALTTSGEVEVVSLVDNTADPSISYADFLPQPLEMGQCHELVVPNKRKVADTIATAAGVVRRKSWGAAPPKVELDPDWDFDTIVIHHSGNSGERSPKHLQEKHFASGYDDIAYQYVVSLDGELFEGRHLAFKSAGNSAHNTGKIAIIVAGDFEHQWWDSDDDPTQAAIDGIVKIVNALKAEFPIKKLVGHRDLPRAKGDTECPGEELYKLLGKVRAQTGLTGP